MEDKVKNFPIEILSLYIGEILIMETMLKNVIKYSKVEDPILSEEFKMKKDTKRDIKNYHKPMHFHVQCMCKGCKIWDSECRECYIENPLNRYNLHSQGIYTCIKNDKVYYNKRHIYPEDFLDDLPFVDIANISLENCENIVKNNTEKKIVELLLREKDPNFIEKHYTNWFKILIKDRLSFTDDTVIMYNVENIIVNASSVRKTVKFTLKSYKGNFTYFHVRLIRKRLLCIKSMKNRSGNPLFNLYGGNGVELDAGITDGNLIINILDL